MNDKRHTVEIEISKKTAVTLTKLALQWDCSLDDALERIVESEQEAMDVLDSMKLD